MSRFKYIKYKNKVWSGSQPEKALVRQLKKDGIIKTRKCYYILYEYAGRFFKDIDRLIETLEDDEVIEEDFKW